MFLGPWCTSIWYSSTTPSLVSSHILSYWSCSEWCQQHQYCQCHYQCDITTITHVRHWLVLGGVMCHSPTRMNRSVSGTFVCPPQLQEQSSTDPSIIMVRTRLAQSSPRLNVFQETEEWYRRQYSSSNTADKRWFRKKSKLKNCI